MFGRKKRIMDELQTSTIDTEGRQEPMPPRQMQMDTPQQQQPLRQLPPLPPLPPPMQAPRQPAAPAQPAALTDFINNYRLFAPDSFTAPGVYEATVCNLLYGIYSELHALNDTEQG